MELTIAYNGAKKGIELFFKGELPKELAIFLRELGFKESLGNTKMWYVDKHPAYESFAISLKEVLAKGEDWRTIIIAPSFAPSLENINANKFSLVTVHYTREEKVEETNYVLFDSYKKVALEIATRFAIKTYGNHFKRIEVFPRNYKVKARKLFKEKQIIYGTIPLENSNSKQPLPVQKKEETAIEKKEESQVVTQETDTSKLRTTLDEVISELLLLEETLEGESETIIGTTLFDLEEAVEEQDETQFKNQLLKSIQLFKDWVDDIDAKHRLVAIASMNKLTQLLDGTSIKEEKKQKKSKAVSKDIFSRDHIVRNVLVPELAGEPFQSGSLNLSDANFIKFKFPELYKINDKNLSEVSGLAMFRLSQMAHPTDYGIDVHRSSVLQEWENRGSEAFKELGFPTDLNYPYVNIHVGYRSIAPLEAEIGANEDSHKWWTVVEHARPIADPAKGIAIIDEMLMELVEKRLEVINPKTGKPKTDKASKETFNDIEWEIQRLERSKQVILDYLNQDNPAEPKNQSKPKKKKVKKQKDYIDRTIAIMHTNYSDAKRLSKKKIEALKEATGAPNLGALWEAVELSWLLWYKTLYKEPIPFEARLKKMIHFWNSIQPTYAYSDSSKELYKQYSTPCPIGAIIAQYTGMDDAEFIFEPSAGNGLLLVGANPRITHVNEIDKSRTQSLEYQKFGRITSENASEPFPETMHRVHDVVVTNPPFAKWEASKFDKERIANKYFNKQRGIARHIRLEHLMAGLALYTMTDNGKSAIIIMGHVYYGDDGLFAKYRPFFNWLYRHYKVDDIINMNSYKLYNKQGTVTKTMLILIGGRKTTPSGVAPNQSEQPHLEKVVETFEDLWEEVKLHTNPNIDTLITQLKTARIQ
ncbi:N-6 DNA methylase [uncultured Algibacter sp.]|uniref:N-6 DNA methylase n=1 Tax=uncultured Algibacter sp. TaxID=298659 RepID=UPI003216895A